MIKANYSLIVVIIVLFISSIFLASFLITSTIVSAYAFETMSSGATGSALDHNSPGFPLNFLSHLATTFTPESEVHQGITKEGLNFLNENVVNKINTGHEFADFISKNQDDPTFHFDSCTFDGATANIKNRYGNILELIQKGDLNSQRGAYEQFGEILHTAGRLLLSLELG